MITRKFVPELRIHLNSFTLHPPDTGKIRTNRGENATREYESPLYNRCPATTMVGGQVTTHRSYSDCTPHHSTNHAPSWPKYAVSDGDKYQFNM